MPVIMLDNDAGKYITSLNHKEEQNADYIRLSMPEPQTADTDDYRHWARSLRDAIS
ncbi:hypothetical protein [uncultured Bacteroides sp.]|uniref:hypothetical protein n=1 Tax=uncultured Bacteroides sp. TaxID=162156 RepID=UPI0026316A98|nr:hypothetical protein [uncultured Bacteroides sp.]